MKYKSNVLFQVFGKAISIGSSFLLVPVSIEILGEVNYGFWVTTLSVITWMSLFDFGLGTVLRNTVTRNFSRKVSRNTVNSEITAVYVFSVLVGLVIIVPLLFIDVEYLFRLFRFKTEDLVASELRVYLSVVLVGILIQFVLKNIYSILFGLHKSGFAAILQGLISLSILLIFYTIGHKIETLKSYAAVFFLITSLLLVLYNILVFLFYKFKFVSLQLKELKLRIGRSLKVSIQFLIIQIASLILFSTDNVIVANIFGLDNVTSYSVLYKYFSIILVAFNILMVPLWSGITEAWHQNRLIWIKQKIAFQRNSLVLALVSLLILQFSQPFFLQHWVGIEYANLKIGYYFVFYVLLALWNNIWSYFLNAVEVLRLQLLTASFAAIVNIPLSYFLSDIFGIIGVVLATIISLVPFAILGPIQTYRLLNEKVDI